MNCGICKQEAIFKDQGRAIGQYWYCRTCKLEEAEWKSKAAKSPTAATTGGTYTYYGYLGGLATTKPTAYNGPLLPPPVTVAGSAAYIGPMYSYWFGCRGYLEPAWSSAEGVYLIEACAYSCVSVSTLCAVMNAFAGTMPGYGAWVPVGGHTRVCISENDLNFFRAYFGLPTLANDPYLSGRIVVTKP